jgi:hypothetical protein
VKGIKGEARKRGGVLMNIPLLYNELDDFDLCGQLARDVSTGKLPFSYLNSNLVAADRMTDRMTTEQVR